MCTDGLSYKEATYCESLLSELKDVQWTKPLINNISTAGGIIKENKPSLFELRFAADLHNLGLSAKYEYKTGINDTSVDFKIEKDSIWLIELLSKEMGKGVKNATSTYDVEIEVKGKKVKIPFQETILSTHSLNKKQSEEWELITVQQKICEKVYSKKKEKYIKFPPISNNFFHIILIDMRGFLLQGGDIDDYGEICIGSRGTCYPPHIWPDKNGKPSSIKGIFETDHPNPGAKAVQERIHFLCFVNEKEYGEGKLIKQIKCFPNSQVFTIEAFYKEVLKKIPWKK